MYQKLIASKFKSFFVIRTKDYRRVISKIINATNEVNLRLNTQYEPLIFSKGVETFEGVEFNKEQFVKDIKNQTQKIYIFRCFCPFDPDEIIQFVEKYTLNENSPTKVFIIDPDYEIPPQIESHVEEIIDFFPSSEEVPQDTDFVEGLSLVELKKASEEENPFVYREKILKKSGGILEILKPHDIDKPVGLDTVISLIEKVFISEKGKGTLLLGVPGTGKTLICKFLAKKYPVVKFNISAVYSKYVGDTEKRLRDAFERLKQFGSCFVFIDEFEKAISHGSGDSGVSKRVLGEFLSWLQDKETNNYVIATMNDISSLPLELVRPGRWDFTFGLTPPPEKVRKEIINYYANKYNVPFDNKLLKTDNITPADIAAIYRLSSIVNLNTAKKFVKLTKDISPNFENIIRIVKTYAVPVYEDLQQTTSSSLF